MAKDNWILALVALFTAVCVTMLGKGLLKLIPIFSGIIVGYVVGLLFFDIDLAPVAAAPWFSLPQFVTPQFSLEAVLFLAPVAIAPVIEHVGDIYAVNSVTGKDFVKDPGLHRTMLGDEFFGFLPAGIRLAISREGRHIHFRQQPHLL